MMLITGVSGLFMPEALAAWSHLKHGNTPEIGGLVVPAPWDAIISADSNSLSLMAFSGRFRGIHLGRKGWAMTTFDPPYSNRSKLARPLSEVIPLYFQKMGFTYTMRSHQVVGEKYQCYEASNTAYKGATEIQCVPETGDGFKISFMGTHDRAPEFYSLLNRIERKTD
ncbi:MAG: hypothetical protein ABIP81_04830 [Terriglobales bacterium]